MNLSYKERQITMFPEEVGLADESRRPDIMAARLTLSIENLVILTIVSIMVILFSFSIGVERGKRVGGLVPSSEVVAVKSATPVEQKTWFGMPKVTSPAEVTTSVPPVDKMRAGSPVKKLQEQGASSVVAAVASPKASGSGYTVQVASYKTEKSAKVEADSLKAKGYREVYVLPKGNHLILCVGNFKNKSDADVFGQKKLRSRYQDFRVRSL